MTSIEDDLNRRQPQGKNIYIEEYLDVSRPQWKPFRKQMTLASQFCTELGPAQPQLVFFIIFMDRRYGGYRGPNHGITSQTDLIQYGR